MEKGEVSGVLSEIIVHKHEYESMNIKDGRDHEKKMKRKRNG